MLRFIQQVLFEIMGSSPPRDENPYYEISYETYRCRLLKKWIVSLNHDVDFGFPSIWEDKGFSEFRLKPQWRDGEFICPEGDGDGCEPWMGHKEFSNNDAARASGKNRRRKPGSIELPPYILDRLGFFRASSPETIFLCHDGITEVSKRLNVPYSIVHDIVCVHELAHLIHFKMNPSEFRKGAAVVDSTTEYVEAWAQYCTLLVARKLSRTHVSVFNKLSNNQPEEYHAYRKYNGFDRNDVLSFFLKNQGWKCEKMWKKPYPKWMTSKSEMYNRIENRSAELKGCKKQLEMVGFTIPQSLIYELGDLGF